MKRYLYYATPLIILITITGSIFWCINKPENRELGITALVNTMTGSTSMKVINDNFSEHETEISALQSTTTMSLVTSLPNLATVGTIGTGVWQGTAIGDSYLTKTGDWTGTFDGLEGSAYAKISDIGSFVTQTYGSSTYALLASNYINQAYGSSTYALLTSNYISQAYGSSTYALLSDNYLKQAYASTTFPTFTYASSTYATSTHTHSSYFDNIDDFTGTLTDTKYCTYSQAGTEIVCNSDAGSGNYGETGQLAYYAATGTTATGSAEVFLNRNSSVFNIYKNSPSANETLLNIYTSGDTSRFSVDEDGDVSADGSLTGNGLSLNAADASILLFGSSGKVIDGFGYEILKLVSMSTLGVMTNEITITNASSTQNPTITSTGADTNINLELSGKGTGYVYVNDPFNVAGTSTFTGLMTLGNASSTSISATTFTGALVGNADTATALASNPSDCSANQFANTIAANGNLTCSALADADIPDTITASNYLSLSDWFSTTSKSNLSVATATALASNPTDCTTGNVATAIDVYGNLTCSATSTLYTFDGTGACASGSVCTGGHNHDVAGLTWANDWMIAYSNGSGLVELGFGDQTGEYLRSNGEGALTWENPTAGYLLASVGSSTYATTTPTFTGTTTIANLRVEGLLDMISTTLRAVFQKAKFVLSLIIPNGANVQLNTAGEIGIDTTSDQLRYFGTATNTVVGWQDKTFTIASSTWNSIGGTGSTTISLGFAVANQTWVSAACLGTTGTSTLVFGDGTNNMNNITSTTSKSAVFTAFSSNNTFTAGEAIYATIGTFTGTPDMVSCTIKRTLDAD